MPPKPKLHKVNIRTGEKTTSREMYTPHGSELINMDILCNVISLLRSNETGCWGSLILHKLPQTNGLLSNFIIHCIRCHVVVAEFSSSLRIGETPQEAINNPYIKRHTETEVNSRTLLAVHSTSMSWRDFLLVCALMDLPVPGRNLNKVSLEYFTPTTAKVSQESMSLCCK